MNTTEERGTHKRGMTDIATGIKCGRRAVIGRAGRVLDGLGHGRRVEGAAAREAQDAEGQRHGGGIESGCPWLPAGHCLGRPWW